MWKQEVGEGPLCPPPASEPSPLSWFPQLFQGPYFKASYHCSISITWSGLSMQPKRKVSCPCHPHTLPLGGLHGAVGIDGEDLAILTSIPQETPLGAWDK